MKTIHYPNKIRSHLVTMMHIGAPTRITCKSATLIDNFYTNFSVNNCHSGILCTDFTDHFPIFCIFDKLSVKKIKPPSLTKRIYNAKT